MEHIDLSTIPLWVCLPFVGVLLCIAILPLVAGEWWEKRQPLVMAVLSIAFIIPFAVLYGGGATAETVLECIFNDYLTFIVLLFGLYCVAGNINLDGNMVGKPKTNIVILLIGTALASFIGTTGASMLFVRPIIKMNKWRSRCAHIMVFFIFLVSNIGGCLTPIGDPPLLMGFSRGVPFTWSMVHMLPVMIVNVVLLLIIFYLLDNRAYKKDLAEGRRPEATEGEKTKIKITGAHNVIFLVMIILAVVLSGVLPKMPAFQTAAGTVISIHIFGEVMFPITSLIEVIIILIAAALSFATTKKTVREANHFTWGAIKEVAVLFIGIFITMQPALMILKSVGGSLGLNHPAQMFWVTGALSSFLDNTPTYLVFLTTTGAMGFTEGISTAVGMIPQIMLLAISCGAVFMGANTYIGNAPNFMVKAISDENGIKMPSFFGYLFWSVRFLVPVFVVDMLIFFLKGL